MLHILLFLMLNISPATQSDRLFFTSDSLFGSDSIINLGKQNDWRFHSGDYLSWANSDFDHRKGTGLVNSLAYDIVKAHGVEIKVETKSAHAGANGESDGLPEGNTGTKFIIHLPFN